MRKLFCLLTGLLLLFSNALFAQPKEVSGRVIDPNGVPVTNASVREKGTRNGTTANSNGMFKITPKDGATLTFTAIGFETIELPAKDQMTVSNDEMPGLVFKDAFLP